MTPVPVCLLARFGGKFVAGASDGPGSRRNKRTMLNLTNNKDVLTTGEAANRTHRPHLLEAVA